MKILFTADWHGSKAACLRFAYLLKSDRYDCGVIAGDILDDDPQQGDMKGIRAPAWSYLRQFLNRYESEFKYYLSKTGKPVFVVKGNHDQAAWTSERNLYNIHLKKIQFHGYSFVGYCHTDFHKWDKDMAVELQRIKHHIDRNTVFVTHAPAYGVLDKRYSGKCSTGSYAIAQVVAERRPSLHLHGHVHNQCAHQGRSVNGAFHDSKSMFAIDLDRNIIQRIGGMETVE